MQSEQHVVQSEVGKKARVPEQALMKQLHRAHGKYLWRNRAVRNMLLEPEVIHMTCMYQELFSILYSCYREKQGLQTGATPATERSELTEGGSVRDNGHPHLTLDDFLALCQDLELVPTFGTNFAFEHAYKHAECAVEVERVGAT